MYLDGLPDDIVYLIEKQVSSTSSPVCEQWTDQLRLLSVCKQWRRIMLPLASNSVFAKYGDKSDLFKKFSAEDTVHEDVNRELVTNADLLSENMYGMYPMHLQMRSYYIKTPLPSLERMLNMFRNERPRWQNVTSLSINLTCGFYSTGSIFTGIGKSKEVIGRVIESFLRIFPNVVELNINGFAGNLIASMFNDQLSTAYAMRLKKFFCQEHMHMSAPSFSSQLTHLEIDVDGEDGSSSHLVRVCAESLIELTLNNMNAGHDWNTFTNESSSNIVFPRLKSLWMYYLVDMHFSKGLPSKMETACLEFPALEHMSVHTTTNYAPFWGAAKLPPKMRSLVIRGASNTFKAVCSAGLPEVDILSLSVVPLKTHPFEESITLLNQILAKTRVTTKSEILLDDRAITFNPTEINCAALTRIRVISLVSADAVLATINRFPSLMSLAFTNVGPEQLPEDVPIAALESNKPITLVPFNTQIEALYLEYRKGQYSQDTMLVLAKYLLLRTPSLKRVILRNLPGRLFCDFLEAYRLTYPHLQLISMR